MFMNMNEFFEKYKLSYNHFAEIAHVGVRSLRKYAAGEVIKEDTKLRIEKAMRVVEKHNLVRPTLNCRAGDVQGYIKFDKDIREYKRNFDKLYNEEET
jgi:predicted transcriptional regulator